MNNYLVALNLIPQIGFKRTKQLIEHFGGNYENIFKVPSYTISELLGLRKKLNYNPKEILKKADEEIKKCDEKGYYICTYDDENYPPLLKEISSPPIVLYVEGNINCLSYPCISIVGTRKPSNRGLKNSFELAKALIEYDITVVSGLAKGIDSSAHKGSVENNGRTCGILGCGLDITYPKTNENLRKEMKKNGCIISEFPLETPPQKMNFPRRNRIIAGLSRACVMVEGTEDSGALITANMAFEMNRSVFAFPGNIENSRYKGTNKLIKKNIASLITCHNDLIDELGNILNIKAKQKNIKEKMQENFENLSNIEKKVFNILDYFETKHIDFIINKTELPVNTVGQVLLSLELKGLIVQKPGKLFLRS